MEIPKKSFDIIKKTFDPSYKKTWKGDVEIEQVFLQMYILDKFKNDIYYQPFKLIFLITTKIGRNFIITDYSKKKLFSPKTIKKYKIGYKNTTKRFSFHTISHQFYGDSCSHALLALHDKKTNEIEFFNRSAGEISDNAINKYQEDFKIVFSEIYGDNVKFKFQENFCIKTKIFTFKCNWHYPKIYEHLGGECVLWVLWYLELRLTNKNLSRKQVLSKTIKLLDSEHFGQKNIPPLACQIIHSYSKFVDNFRGMYEIDKTPNGNMIRIKKIIKKHTPIYKKAEKMLKQFIIYTNAYFQKNLKKIYKLV